MAEDQPLIAITVSDTLEGAGFAVEVVHDAAAAEAVLATANSGAIVGLVTDIRLGAGSTGWELARVARGRSPTIPVVYISGDSAADHSVQGVPDSIMIQKPFVPAQLVTALATLLNAQSTTTTTPPAA